jgi:hypothetical protein
MRAYKMFAYRVFSIVGNPRVVKARIHHLKKSKGANIKNLSIKKHIPFNLETKAPICSFSA